MPLGLYIHVPFCRSKCAYCDFFSFAPDEAAKDEYTEKIIEDIKNWAARLNRAADTLYFGGGTPSLLGGNRLARIIIAAREGFGLKGAEITVECNPGDDLAKDFAILKSAGVNRVSIGAQSGLDNELKSLSRRHNARQIEETVLAAKNAGISNISLDIMLGIPQQTAESLKKTVEFFASLPISHISAYILKVEKGTPMELRTGELPDEDATADLYLQACRLIEDAGFKRYEISNFAKSEMESRHNLKYWNCEEYLGLGPSAHSFLNGRRFCFERDFEGYLAGNDPVEDGAGGDTAERMMLALRLEKGIDPIEFCEAESEAHFKLQKHLEKFCKAGLMKQADGRFSFTHNGALVSNECIIQLIECLE